MLAPSGDVNPATSNFNLSRPHVGISVALDERQQVSARRCMSHSPDTREAELIHDM